MFVRIWAWLRDPTKSDTKQHKCISWPAIAQNQGSFEWQRLWNSHRSFGCSGILYLPSPIVSDTMDIQWLWPQGWLLISTECWSWKPFDSLHWCPKPLHPYLIQPLSGPCSWLKLGQLTGKECFQKPFPYTPSPRTMCFFPMACSKVTIWCACLWLWLCCELGCWWRIQVYICKLHNLWLFTVYNKARLKVNGWKAGWRLIYGVIAAVCISFYPFHPSPDTVQSPFSTIQHPTPPCRPQHSSHVLSNLSDIFFTRAFPLRTWLWLLLQWFMEGYKGSFIQVMKNMRVTEVSI